MLIGLNILSSFMVVNLFIFLVLFYVFISFSCSHANLLIPEHLRGEIKLNNDKTFSSYLTGNTLNLHYKIVG
jgi:hypothetical protein